MASSIALENKKNLVSDVSDKDDIINYKSDDVTIWGSL